jgi:hypothetical protein
MAMRKYFEMAIHWIGILIVMGVIIFEIFDREQFGWIVFVLIYLQIHWRLQRLEQAQNETHDMTKELWQELRREQDSRFS